MKGSIFVLAAAGILACGETHYVYAPETANATYGGMPASRTAIPPEEPQGAVEVTSYGTTELHSDGSRLPVIHVRMVVTNDGDDTPWHLDTSQQLVEIPGEGRSAPIYVNADVRTLPALTIARRERRVIDLYYPLPTTISSDTRLPRFDVLWQVETPAREVASRTSFDRIAPQAEASSYGYAYEDSWPLWAGFGPYWWYDPFYPRVVFAHARPIGIRGHGRIAVGGFHGGFRTGGAHVAHGGHHR